MVARRNVAHLKAGIAVDARQVRVGVEAEVLVIEQADDGNNPQRLRGIDPSLHLSHTNRLVAVRGVARPCASIEFFGNDW